MLKSIKTGILFGILLLLAMTGISVSAQAETAETKTGSYYTVTFHTTSGSVDSVYRKLRMKVKANRVISLPEIPEKKGYKNIGWAHTANAASAEKKTSEKVRVSKNLDYYAVQKKCVAITFHRNDGRVIKTDYVISGRRLPTLKNQQGYTFMGWSSKPYQQKNPEYQAGDYIKVKRTTHLYAVEFDRNTEIDYTAAKLPKIDTSKYAGVIFVGDSRTQRMQYTLYNEGGTDLLKNVAFVCKGGEGLGWFKAEGEQQLYREIKKMSKSSKKPVAVVFNLGVNDLYKKGGRDVNLPAMIKKYVNYMLPLGDKLKDKGCRLYYMSVNPYNSVMLPKPGSRDEEDARVFNEGIREGLSRRFAYLNTYDELMRTGYSTDSGRGVNLDCDDGLHYTTETYKRIYRYCIKKINR